MASHINRTSPRWSAAKIILYYVLFSVIWIVGSDKLIESLVSNKVLLIQLEILKGIFFVSITATLLYLLIQRQLKSEIEKEIYNRVLFEESSTGLALTNMDGKLVDVNQAYANIIGYSIDETLKLSYWDITPKKYEKDEQVQLESLQKNKCYGPYEKEYIHKDGSLIPVRLQGRLIDFDGQQMIWSSIEDISDRVKSESKLERTRVFQEAILECIADGIVACDSEGVLSYFNQATKDFHGLPQKDINPSEWAEYYDLYEADGITPLEYKKIPLFRALKGEKVLNQEITIKPKGMPERVMVCTGTKLIDSKGEILGAVVSMNDITERTKLEHEEINRRLHVTRYNETLTDLIRHPSFISGDLNSFISTLTRKLSEALKVSRVSVWKLNKIDAISNITCLDLFDAKTNTHSKDVVLTSEDFPIYFETLMTDRTLLFDDVYNDDRVKDFTKEYFPANQVTSMLDAPFHFSGKIAGVLCFEHTGEKRKWKIEEEAFVISAADILSIVFEASQRKELEATIQRTDKMDSLGKLTGGVAHDYNNMLGVILGYSELLEASLTDNENLMEYVKQINHAGKRGAKLTKKLLDFSRNLGSDAEKVDINSLLTDEKDMLEKTLTVRIKVNYDLDENLWPAWIDKNDMEDAILNLSINAMHAIEGPGELSFKTCNEHLNAVNAQYLNLHQGDYVTLIISDTGSGMTEAVRKKIFDPFYSTKGENGTGLGLSQVYGFVQRSNAAVKVYSEVGKGTQFKFYFPKYIDERISDDSQDEDQDNDLSGSESVLVVDDEEALMRLASEILQNAGYKVYGVTSAKQALEILSENKIDLVITDIIMPDMDGIELANIINDKYPYTRVQLASGYSDKSNFDKIDKSLEDNILNKPYNSQTLLRRVNEIVKR